MEKICHITTVHKNRYDVRIFEKECSFLANSGYDVTLIVNDDKEDETKNGVKVISLNKKPHGRIDRAIRISKYAYKKAISIDADLYHVHDPELLRIAIKLAKKGKKVIFDSHEFTAMQILYDKTYLPKLVRRILSKKYRRWEIKTLNKLSGLIYPCFYDGGDYFKDVHTKKVIVGNQPLLSMLDSYKHSEDEDGEFCVCYVGDISFNRGIVQMVKACASAKVKLVLIGEIPTDVYDVISQIDGFGLVVCKGKMKHDDAMAIASKCSAGLSLLQNQGQYAKLDNLPTKIYEYMAMGLPTVISNFPFYEKVLTKYRFGIAVEPDNTEEIAKAILYLKNSKQERNDMAEAGIEAIKEEMNWEKEGKKMLNFYEEVLKKNESIEN